MRTQITIIGGGPAGLFLAHILIRAGIDAIVIERRDRAYIEQRVRAGVLERTTINLLRELGVSERMELDGLIHEGIKIGYDGDTFRIDFGTSAASHVLVYGQQEIMRDLFDAATQRNVKIFFDANNLAIHDVAGTPSATFDTKEGHHTIASDFVVGCDGSHGFSRTCIPVECCRTYTRAYPFGWLGILAEVPPADAELIYSNHENGFALASMRSASRSRYYIQCGTDDSIENWSDERFWDELCLRLGPEAAAGLVRGPSFEKTIAPLHSFVIERCKGKLFLAGDAAHVVPPTGAKGMNLAVSDVIMLGQAFRRLYEDGDRSGIEGYSARALARVWKAERFSWWFTSVTHRFPTMTGFERKLQLAELAYIRGSEAARASFAENYVGLPLDGP